MSSVSSNFLKLPRITASFKFPEIRRNKLQVHRLIFFFRDLGKNIHNSYSTIMSNSPEIRICALF